jgi:hypothetical protein
MRKTEWMARVTALRAFSNAHRGNLRVDRLATITDSRDVTRYILAILLLCWLPALSSKKAVLINICVNGR